MDPAAQADVMEGQAIVDAVEINDAESSESEEEIDIPDEETVQLHPALTFKLEQL